MRYGYRLKKGELSTLKNSIIIKKGRGVRNGRGGGKVEILDKFGFVEAKQDCCNFKVNVVTNDKFRIQLFMQHYENAQCEEIEPGKYRLTGNGNI